MVDRDDAETGRRAGGALRTLSDVAWGPPGVIVVLLALVWLVLPQLPEGSGLRFGIGFRVFFSAIIVAAGLFFAFLGLGPLPQPRREPWVLASIVGVYLATVGSLIGIGNAYLQFETPRVEETSTEVLTPEQRGEELFWSPEVGCFRCHSLGGRGGTRAPDLSGIAGRASSRIPGLPAEEYIRGHILEGSGFRFNVPDYPRIMPPFARVLSEADLEALIRFLMTQK